MGCSEFSGQITKLLEASLFAGHGPTAQMTSPAQPPTALEHLETVAEVLRQRGVWVSRKPSWWFRVGGQPEARPGSW